MTDGRKSSRKTGDEGPWWHRSDAELIKDRYNKVKDTLQERKMDVDEEDRAPLIRETRKRDPRVKNLLDQRVVRRKGVSLEGKCLLVPVYRTSWGRKIATLLHLKTVRRIYLDDYGLIVWESINGRRNVRQIGRILRRRFGEEVEPLYPRLSKFLAYFQSMNLIRIRSKDD